MLLTYLPTVIFLGDEERLTYLKNTMLSFCKMEREVKQFIDAATFAKNQVCLEILSLSKLNSSLSPMMVVI